MVKEMKEIKGLKQMAAEVLERLGELRDYALNEIGYANELANEIIYLNDGIDEIDDEDEREELEEQIDKLYYYIDDANTSFELYDQATNLVDLVESYIDDIVTAKALDMIETANDVAQYIETHGFVKLVDVMPENEQKYLIQSRNEMEKIERDSYYYSQYHQSNLLK